MRKYCLKILKCYYMNVVEALQSKYMYVELSIKFHRQLEAENQNLDTLPHC